MSTQKQVFLKQVRERDGLIRMRDGLLVGVAQFLGRLLQQKVRGVWCLHLCYLILINDSDFGVFFML